jgi:hypothetical protein
LEKREDENMNLNVYKTKVASPECWDTPPFAYNLKFAAEGFKPNVVVDRYLKKSHFINKSRIALGAAAHETNKQLNRSHPPPVKIKVQQAFTISFKRALLPETLNQLLAGRFEKHFALLCAPGFTPDWENLISTLKTSQTHYVMIALKTLLNSWCTKGRYHDDSFADCIFGCIAADDISHYVCCTFLWGICAQAAGTCYAENVEERILLREPSKSNLALLVTAFTAYHAIKLGHASEVTNAERTGDYRALLALTRRIADAQWMKSGLPRSSNYVLPSVPSSAPLGPLRGFRAGSPLRVRSETDTNDPRPTRRASLLSTSERK